MSADSSNVRSRAGTAAKSVALVSVVGVLSGLASALFLWLLDTATGFRESHGWIVYTLPLAGLAIGFVYERFGESIRGGSSLVIETIRRGGAEIPTRMAPMVLVGTVLTHLFGGSAGREGAAVQVGASLADWLAHLVRAGASLRRELLVAGVAAGFGSVFGTPIAGAVFALEFVVLGRVHARVLIPAVLAAVLGDFTTRALGIVHTPYPASPALELTPLLAFKWVLFAAAIALTATLFIELTHAIKRLGTRFVPRLPFRMFAGGLIIIVLWKVVGTGDYLGLGVPTIVRAFADPSLPTYAFALKLLFSAVTLGAGFLGGEVTPLFFVGAALGATLAGVLGIPLELGAGVGLAAMFAAASNTPLALSIMAVELLGANVLPHVAIASVLAYALVGARSIYPSQHAPHEPGESP